MSQEKKLYEYINKEMMYADTSLPIGSYCICKDTEQLYLYTNRDEFGVELQGNERWVPKYPENLTLHMPEDSYVSPEEFNRVTGNIQAHVETVENDYQSRDNSVLAESKGYTDGKISNIERDIDTLEDSIEFVRSGANTEINKLKDQDIQIIGRLERLESGGPDISTELNELNQQVAELETKVNDLDPTTGSYVSKKEYAENNQKVSNDITTINAAIANQKADLDGYKTTVEKTYVKQDTLTEYATKDEVTTAKNEAIGAAVSAMNGSLENYATSDEIKDVYSTKEELNEYKTIVDDTYISNEELNEYKEEVIQHIADVKKEIISEPITYMPSLEVKDEAFVGNNIPYYVGKTAKELREIGGALYGDILDNILFDKDHKVLPEVTQPSATMTLRQFYSYFTEEEFNQGFAIREVGSKGVDDTEFSFESDRGNVKYANGVEKFFAGEAITTENYDDAGDISRVICTFNNEEIDNPHEVLLGTREYKYRVWFKAGEKVTNNWNEPVYSWNRSTPVDSVNSIKLCGTKPWYASSEKTEDGSLTKQPLILWDDNHMEVYTSLLPSCIMPQTFSIPRPIKNFYIKQAGNYCNTPMIKFLDPVVEGDYYTYTYNHETYGHRGAIEIKIEF